jgi:uncharacterized protein (TIGR02001 family)
MWMDYCGICPRGSPLGALKPTKLNQMKKIIAVTAILVAATAGLRAEESSVAATIDLTYASKYIFRGVVLGEQAFHPSVEVSYSDFYAGVWGNEPLGSKDTYPDNNEWDFYVGKTFALSDVTTLDVGYTFYYYPEKMIDKGTDEFYVGINFDANGFSPGFYVYYDQDLEAWTYQGSVGTSFPIESFGTSLDLTATLGRVDGSGGFEYTYWSVGAAVPFKLSEKSTVTAGASFASHDIDGLDDDNLALTVSYTFSF